MESITAWGITSGFHNPNRPNISITDAAAYGDRVLCSATRAILKFMDDYRVKQPVYNLLNSNDFLNEWDTGFTRVKDTKSIKRERKKGKLNATLTEAWIYFLYENYGEDHTMRYIKKQIKKHAPKYIDE